MSAYIVSHSLIDALLTFAIRDKVGYYVAATKQRIDITLDNATEVGRILLTENERSVYFRYDDLTANSKDKPGTIGEDAQTYEFSARAGNIPAIVILKACSCFDYQSCETNDYEGSLAFTIINAIRASATSDLPGWSQARGWDDFVRKHA